MPTAASCVDASNGAFRLVPVGLRLQCRNGAHGSLFDSAAAKGGGDGRLRSGVCEGLATRSAKLEGRESCQGFEGACEEPGGHCCVCENRNSKRERLWRLKRGEEGQTEARGPDREMPGFRQDARVHESVHLSVP